MYLLKIKGTNNSKLKICPFLAILGICCILPIHGISYARQPETDNKCSDTFVYGSIGDARILNPIFASDTSSSGVCSYIFHGLIKYDKDLNIVGELARSWDIKDGGKRIIFHLKKGVLWHDGIPFTSKDVKFTYEKIVNPEFPSPYSGDFETIARIETPDDYTVKVYYKEPFSPALGSWGIPIIPAHIFKDFKNIFDSPYNRDPVGTGPFTFKFWKTQEKIILERNPDYYDPPVMSDYVVYKVIPDTATLYLELVSTNIDYSGLTPLQFKFHSNSGIFQRNYTKFKKPALAYTYMGYNLKHPLFKNKEVRQALNYAVNKERIIQGVLFGEGIISTGPFVPSQWCFNPRLSAAEYRPEKARVILKEAGWEDKNGDGVLEKGDLKFEFTVITNQGNTERQKVMELIQEDLKKIGVKVNIKIVEWSVFISEYINKKNFEAVLLGWSLGYEPDPFDIFHSSRTAMGQFNFGYYRNPEVDRLIEEGRRTFDRDKRTQIYGRIQEIIYEDQPYMFLFVPYDFFALHKRFREVKLEKAGIFYNFKDWYVECPDKKYKFLFQQ